MAIKYPGVSNENGRCFIRWRAKGRRYSKALDIKYTQAGIKQAYKLLQTEILNSRAGIEETLDRGATPTFFAVAKLMLELSQVKPSSRRIIKSHLNNFWIPLYHDRPIDKIQRKDIKRDFAAFQQKYSGKYAKDVFSAGSTVFDVAIDEEWIDLNPVLAISKKVKVTSRNLDPFTFEERDQLLDSLNLDHHVLFYVLRFYNGLRPGEAIALRWSDYRDGKLYITRNMYRGLESTPKGNAERVVPAHPKVAELLRTTPRNLHDDHIILKEDQTPYLNPNPLTAALTSTMKRLQMRHRSPYNARHTCASMMLHAQITPARCAEYLGHSLEMFFRKYASLIEDAQGQKLDEERFAKSL